MNQAPPGWDEGVPVASGDPSGKPPGWDEAKPVDLKLPKAGAPKPKAKPEPAADEGGAGMALGWLKRMLGANVAAGEGALSMGSGMLAKPLSDVAGLAAIPADIMGGGKGDPKAFKEDVQRRLTYEPRTEGGRSVAENNPLALIARLFGAGGNMVERGVKGLPAPQGTGEILRDALASGAKEGFEQLPTFAGAKAAPKVAAAGESLKGSGRSWMQSALKPLAADLKSGDAAKGIETMLKEGVNVTRGGADKLQGKVDVLNDAISKAIDGSPAVVDKQIVGYRLQGLMDRFKKQVTPTSDLKIIQKAWDDFLANFPDKIPVKEAQEVKQGTYRAIGDKAYGELKGADIEAQKTLARGMKEEIARAVPAVRALNAEESKLLNALSLVERRVLMSANKNPVGLGWLTTDPKKFAAWMADRSETFKSLVARMLYTSGEALELTGPLASSAPAAGIAASQLRPPPDDQQ